MEHEIELNLQQEEIRPIRAALGEVCYGFSISEFEGVLGGTEQEAGDLFKRFDKLSDVGKAVHITVAEKELDIISNAVRETLRELGPEEFQIRTGASFELGKTVLAKLASVKSRHGS